MHAKVSTSLAKLARRAALFALACGALACSGEDLVGDGEPELAAPPLEPGSVALAEFRARLDPKSKSFTFERARSAGSALEARSMDEVTIHQDGVAGSGPAGILYHDMTSADSLRAAGASATIGVQDESGTIAASSGGEQFGTGASAAYAPIS